MSQADVKQIDDEGEVKPKRRFDARDWDYIAEFVIDEYEKRKNKRKDRERCWAEIDRQIEMKPDTEFKYVIKNGTRVLDQNKAWMAEMELPLQAQALEVLTADARRMMFPDSGPWFTAHAEMTDEYLREVDFQSLIKGDESEVPSLINQDNADKLTEGYLLHLFGQSDLQTRIDRINAESFKYGMGVGRGRMETKSVFIHEARGVVKETQKIPVLVPCSIKNLYLDDIQSSMHSSQVLGEAHIARDYMKLENLKLAAAKGSTDPDDEDGGWMPQNLRKIEPDDNGYVTVLEMEGDIIVPRKTTRSMILPGAIVTVILGGKESGGDASRGVVRFRFRKYPFSSYLLFPYHYEGAEDQYPTSPLMKGRPVQITATHALNRLMDSAMLKNSPPVSYDRTDMHFAQQGGPAIYPMAQWASSDPGAIKAHTELGGDPGTLASVFSMSVNMYAELTGVLPARLGAQTNSHTTAFAKDAELQRGAVRTVDYVRQSGQGPLTRWLDMAYCMGREAIGSAGVSFFISAYGGFVEVTKNQLPKTAVFEWFGSGGPAEEVQKRQMRIQSLGTAAQMEQLGVQMGKQPRLDIDAAMAQVLREGGWTDVDAVLPPAPASSRQAPGQVQAVPAPQQLELLANLSEAPAA
jgi:hypothetical protein